MHSVWAVAVNTVKQALRLRIAAIFIILLFVLLPLMGFTTTGDGTLKGRLQTFVSYGLSLTSLLLCLLTIMVSAYTLSSDILQRQIYTVITKPIRRFQYILGKLLGVILLDMLLLILFSAIIYAVTIYMPKFTNAPEDEIVRAQNEFFTARAGLTPIEVDVEDEVLKQFEKYEKAGQLKAIFPGASKRKILAEITKQKQLGKRAAVVGRELIWEFEGVKPLGPDQSLFIRYKYDVSVTPPDLQVTGGWLIGDLRNARHGMPPRTDIYKMSRSDMIRTFHEIEFSAKTVTKDGYLGVAFYNVPTNKTVIIFPLEEGLELLYKADNFTSNFLRTVLLIFLRLIFLSCLGMLAASFLSFPVALLFCLVIFFTANFSGFGLESFTYLSDDVSSIYSYTVGPVIKLLPQFDKFNPTEYLISARLLSWPVLAEVLLLMVCVKGLLLLLLALLIFNYREIARVTV